MNRRLLTFAPAFIIFLSSVHANALPYVCVGAPRGLPGPEGGWFEYVGPETYPPQGLSEALCSAGGSVSGTRRVFGNSFTQGKGSGTYFTENMQLCQLSYSADWGNYLLCGDVLSDRTGRSPGAQGIGADVWSMGRAIIENANRLPGIFSERRGQAWDRTLHSAAKMATKRVNQLTTALDGTKNTAQTYSAQILVPAVQQSLVEPAALRSSANDWKTTLEKLPAPVPITDADYSLELEQAVKQGSQRIQDAAVGPEVSAWISTLESAQTAGDAARVWQNLETIQDLLAGPVDGVFNETDLALFSETTTKWIDASGFIQEDRLTDEGRTLRSAIISQIRTPLASEPGRAVRRELNRGLLAFGLPDSPTALNDERRGSALGGLALALGADEAYQAGSRADGDTLIQHAAGAIDVALGLTPVPFVSSANDFAQIVHGMVTGYDYTGARMAAGDYALRGVGVVLGVFGGEVATAGKGILRIGEKSLNSAFVRGATLIREAAVGLNLVEYVRKFRHQLVELTEAIGTHAKHLALSVRYPEVREILKTLPRSSKIEFETAEMANEAVRVFDYSIPPFMPHTMTMTITLAEEKTLWRAFGGDEGKAGEFGRWLGALKPNSMSKEQYRQLYSVTENMNDLTHFRSVTLKPGTKVRISVAGGIPEAGLPGKGIQWDLLDMDNDTLQDLPWGEIVLWQ